MPYTDLLYWFSSQVSIYSLLNYHPIISKNDLRVTLFYHNVLLLFRLLPLKMRRSLISNVNLLKKRNLDSQKKKKKHIIPLIIYQKVKFEKNKIKKRKEKDKALSRQLTSRSNPNCTTIKKKKFSREAALPFWRAHY